jgi:hypothetical protein
MFSVDSCDLRPTSQYICRILWFMWFLAIMWDLNVNERSSMRPRYLTSFFAAVGFRVRSPVGSQFFGL